MEIFLSARAFHHPPTPVFIRECKEKTKAHNGFGFLAAFFEEKNARSERSERIEHLGDHKTTSSPKRLPDTLFAIDDSFHQASKTINNDHYFVC